MKATFFHGTSADNLKFPLPPPPIPSHPSILVSGKGAIGTATQNQMKNVLAWRKRKGLK